MTITCEQERFCKEKIVTDLKVLPWQLHGEVGKVHENVSHDGHKSDRDFTHVYKKTVRPPTRSTIRY